MSSLVRRIEKNRLKKMGWSRNKQGFIEDGNGETHGKHWPRNFAFPLLNKPKKEA